MRRKINLHTGSDVNSVTNVWFEHLIRRIIVEQLDVPYRLKAKLLHQTLLKKSEGK